MGKPDRIEVGKRIKIARYKKGLSLQELGDLINRPKSTLNSYERGLGLPKEDILARLAVLLDVPLDYLKWGETEITCKNCKANNNNYPLCIDCATRTHAQLVDASALLKASKFTCSPEVKETMLLQLQAEINHVKNAILYSFD